MKSGNLFTASALMSKKSIIVAKSETKREARETLAVFATALASEFGRLTKSESKRVREEYLLKDVKEEYFHSSISTFFIKLI